MLNNNKFIFSLLAVFFLALASLQPVSAMEGPVLSVEGTGEARLAPDQASLSLGVITTGTSAQEVQAENARKMQAALQAVKALGIEDRFIKTSNISLRPRYDHRDSGRKLKGYDAVNSIRVEVKELGKVGRVIDSALRAGVSRVDSLDFSLQAPERLQQEALRKAVADARSKAETMAAALGRRIVGLKQVSESTSGYGARNYALGMVAAKMTDEAAPATPVEPGELEMSASVHIEFILSE